MISLKSKYKHNHHKPNLLIKARGGEYLNYWLTNQ